MMEEEKTTVVNCRTSDYDVFIGRPSLWGNPFKVGRDGNRQECLDKFRDYLKDKPYLIEAAKEMLKGRVLGCYCKPLPCHGDIWVEVIEKGGDQSE